MRTISVGNQDFAVIRENDYFYIDKTKLIREWFSECGAQYNAFVQAMLRRDLDSMNVYMNRVALAQIERKQYDSVLLDRGIPEYRIYKYGFAFKGKKVLIGQQNKDSVLFP